MKNACLLVSCLAGLCAAGEPPAFAPQDCSSPALSRSTAAWKAAENPYLRYSVPSGWQVVDRLERWTAPVSTTTSARLVVDFDWSLKTSTKPVLMLFGAGVPGRPEAAGVWLDGILSHAAARGDDPLGRVGNVLVRGIGTCPVGVVELNARRACAKTEAPCRRASVYMDCGGKDAVTLSVSGVFPAYPDRGAPTGKAAEAQAALNAFLCTLEYKGKP